MNVFFKGLSIGMVAGAAAAIAIAPIDKKRVMRSSLGKTIKTLEHTIENVRNAF